MKGRETLTKTKGRKGLTPGRAQEVACSGSSESRGGGGVCRAQGAGHGCRLSLDRRRSWVLDRVVEIGLWWQPDDGWVRVNGFKAMGGGYGGKERDGWGGSGGGSARRREGVQWP